jgi:hypothetical protein
MVQVNGLRNEKISQRRHRQCLQPLNGSSFFGALMAEEGCPLPSGLS